jgi:carbon-monoxide dehydrogenase medium subunit
LKPPPFEYFAPTTLSEAVDLLSSSDNARLLAGGQSLMAMLNMRYVFPDRIVDLNRVAELDFIREDNDEIVVGAMTRQRTLQRSAQIGSRIPVLPKALRHVGHFQTRNRGTIGGSLCQLDPSAELPAVAMAYDAVIEAIGPNGPRLIPFAEFPLMFMTPSIATNEIVTAIRLKPWKGMTGSGFREFSRRHGDFAIGGAIALLRAGADGIIQQASLTLFGIAEAPVRARDAEALLTGSRIDNELFKRASQLCIPLATLADTYGSADYRAHVAAAMAQHALVEAATDMTPIQGRT